MNVSKILSILVIMLMMSSVFGIIQIPTTLGTTDNTQVTVKIRKILEIDSVDPGTGAEWQWKVSINGDGETGTANGNEVEPNWERTWELSSSNDRYFDVIMWLEEEDLHGWPNSDDVADISADPDEDYQEGDYDNMECADQNNWDDFPRNTTCIGTVDRHLVDSDTGLFTLSSWSGDQLSEGTGNYNNCLVTDGTSDGSVGGDEDNDENDVKVWFSINCTQYNNEPDVPIDPSGETLCEPGISYAYSTSTTDPEGDDITYGWDWDGDGTVEANDWTSSCSIDYTWNTVGTYNVKVKAEDQYGEQSGFSDSLEVTVSNSPDTPSKPSGPESGNSGTSYTYSTGTDDPDGDNVKYGWYWDDGSALEWTSNYPSGDTCSIDHTWTTGGTYHIKVMAEDINGIQSDFSESAEVIINNPPDTPSIIEAPTSGLPGEKYDFYANTDDPDGNMVRYGWNWTGSAGGTEFNVDDWTDHYTSGEDVRIAHSWTDEGTYYVRVIAEDIDGLESSWSSPSTITIAENSPPNQPDKPSGPTSGKVGEEYSYTTKTRDPDGNQVYYKFNWSDGESGWLGPYSSNDQISTRHTWTTEGDYDVKVLAKDIHDAESEHWSEVLQVQINVNVKPSTPERPTGDISCHNDGTSYTYSTRTTDPNNDNIKYGWDWDDDSSIEWIPSDGYLSSGAQCTVTHKWSNPGTYNVSVKAEDIDGAESGFSQSLKVTVNGKPINLIIDGPTEIKKVVQQYTYFFSAEDPENETLQYRVNWGDDTDTGWISCNSGEEKNETHRWGKDAENPTITFEAKDKHSIISKKTLSLSTSKNKEDDQPSANNKKITDINQVFIRLQRNYPGLNLILKFIMQLRLNE